MTFWVDSRVNLFSAEALCAGPKIGHFWQCHYLVGGLAPSHPPLTHRSPPAAFISNPKLFPAGSGGQQAQANKWGWLTSLTSVAQIHWILDFCSIFKVWLFQNQGLKRHFTSAV